MQARGTGLESRDRRPTRPSPGAWGAWSHGSVVRVAARPAPAPEGAAHSAAASAPTAAVPGPDRRPLASLPARTATRVPLNPRPLPAAPHRLTTASASLPPLASRPAAQPPVRNGFGLPSLRRNVCSHFYMTSPRGAIPIQAPHLLKGLLRQPTNISRCQLRGGVHLDEGYVNDVCLTPRFNQCVFYEDELTRA